jgi:thiol-disulfide isomerase/thioredoxin
MKRAASVLTTILAMAVVSCDDDTSSPNRGSVAAYALPYMNFVDLDLDKLLQAPDGTVANIEHLKGKVVILEFWATWCGPCAAAMPHLNEVARACREAGDPVVFIAITPEDEATVQKFLADHPIEGWVGLDKPSGTAGTGATAKRFGVQGIPHTVVIDQHGFLVAHTWSSLLTREGILNLMKSRPYPPSTQPQPTTSR